MSYCFHGQVDTFPPAAAAQGHVPLETRYQVEMPAAGRSRSHGLSPPMFLTLYTSPGSGLTHPHCSQEERSRDQDASRQAEEEVDLQRGFHLSELAKPFPAAL